MEIIEKRRRLREEIIGKARKWAENLPAKITAILIGSYARGDFNLWSDIDILLISDLKGNPIERLREIDYPPGFQVIPLTPKEFQRLIEKGERLMVEAKRHGVVLRDDYELFRG